MRGSDVVLVKDKVRWMLWKAPNGTLHSGGPGTKAPERMEFRNIREAEAKGWRVDSLTVYLRNN